MRYLLTIIILYVFLYTGCTKSDEQVVDSLKKLGVTVIDNEDGKKLAMLAGGPDEISVKVSTFCEKEKIAFLISGGHGKFALYVEIKDFYKAQKLLLRFKREQNLDKLHMYAVADVQAIQQPQGLDTK